MLSVLQNLPYADDSSLVFPINTDEDVDISNHIIQNDLDSTDAWPQIWKLKFKASKSNEVFWDR
jgi:hypothetical protein